MDLLDETHFIITNQGDAMEKITHCRRGALTPVPQADREKCYRRVRKFDDTFTREDLEGDNVFYVEGDKGMYLVVSQLGASLRLDPAGEDEWQEELEFYRRTDGCVAFTSQNR